MYTPSFYNTLVEYKSTAMGKSIEEKFNEWARGRDPKEARINIYMKIRDIPYAVIPELIDPHKYVAILDVNRGSCSPKHFLLRDMYERLDMLVLYVAYPFKWDEIEIDYPPRLRRLASRMPLSHHLTCRVDIDGKLVLVDATIEPALERLGIPVNKTWDGISDMILPVKPCGEEELFHPHESSRIQAIQDKKSLIFYSELNSWLEEVRRF